MHYYIDGYNLLFQLFHSSKELRAKREMLIDLLQEKLSALALDVTIIFEGKHHLDEQSGREYLEGLQMIFTPKGQSADEYILQELSHTFHPSQYTIVTSDISLSRHCRSFGAYTMTTLEFLKWLENKRKKSSGSSPKKKPEFQDSHSNIERLIKIFEKKLKEE